MFSESHVISPKSMVNRVTRLHEKNMQYLGRYGIGMAYHFMFKPLDQPVPPNTNTTEWPSAPQSSSGSGLWPGRRACIQQGPADQSHRDGHRIHLCSPPGFEKS